MTDDIRLLRIRPNDNVVIARGAVPSGTALTINDQVVTIPDEIALGFKLAAGELPEGTIVIRSGVPIGVTSTDVHIGELVHTHNMESRYLRTHARGES